MNVQARIEEARQIVREALEMASPGAPLLVNFSGGRDSMCVILLALMDNDNIRALYMASGIDLPGSVEHTAHAAQVLGVPLLLSWPHDYQGDLADLVRRWGQWPCVDRPWCSGRLKLRPARAMLRKLYGNAALAKLTGVRRQESSRRRRMYRAGQTIVKDPEHSGSYLVHPILSWTDSDVDTFLAQHTGLPVRSPLYADVGVSGCYWCPFYTQGIIVRVERMFPGIYDSLIDLEREVGKPSLGNHTYLRHVIEGARRQMELPIERDTGSGTNTTKGAALVRRHRKDALTEHAPLPVAGSLGVST